jgi:MoaA/NifB/PqqE/SkfB family radical SAM enzyme
VTNRCNAHCAFCAWSHYQGHDELSTEEVKRLYADARAAGFVGLSAWGGEPLVRRDIGELLRHAWELGLRTNMVTNGALLMRKLDRVLPYLDRVTISLDHPSERHDELRGIPGLYEKILAATREIRRRAPKKPVVYCYTFQRGNADPLSIRRAAAVMQREGVVGVFNAMRLQAATDQDVDLDRFNPDPAELAQAFRTVRALKKRGYPVVNSFRHLEMMEQGQPEYRCHWPKFMLPVEANGDVVDCMHWGTRPVGNLRDEPLPELLRHPRLRALAGEAGEACHRCVSVHRVEISEVCEGRFEPLLSWGLSVI